MSFESGGSQKKRVTDLSFSGIREILNKRPYLILPVGSLEPFGDYPLGTLGRVTQYLSEKLSEASDILLAPLFTYGHATPFISFEGCSGLHASTLVKSVYDCCNSWFFTGIERIIILTCSMDGSSAIAPAVQRLNRHPLHKNSVLFFSLQEDAFFRSWCEEHCGSREIARSEWGIEAMIHYIDNDRALMSKPASEPVPDAAEVTKWRKCGKDPEKLRKIAPLAVFNKIPAPTVAQGADLIGSLTENLQERIISFLKTGKYAA